MVIATACIALIVPGDMDASYGAARSIDGEQQSPVNEQARTRSIGDSADDPGISCKHILDRGASMGDGFFSIDPTGAGAFQA